MAAQDRFQEHLTPQDLFAAIPEALPMSLLRLVAPGTYKFHIDILESVPRLPWNHQHNLKPMTGSATEAGRLAGSAPSRGSAAPPSWPSHIEEYTRGDV